MILILMYHSMSHFGALRNFARSSRYQIFIYVMFFEPLTVTTTTSGDTISFSAKAWYALSKTLAEKAAWKFCEENKIDLVTVLPSFVVGPSLPPQLASTAADILGLLRGMYFLNNCWNAKHKWSKSQCHNCNVFCRRDPKIWMSWQNGICTHRWCSTLPHPCLWTRTCSGTLPLYFFCSRQ